MFCNKCGNQIPDGVMFCSKCGTKTEVKSPTVCKNCRASIKGEEQFCSACGTPLKEVKKVFCTNCGKQIAEIEQFCPECGKPMAKQEKKGYMSIIPIRDAKSNDPETKRKAFNVIYAVTAIMFFMAAIYWCLPNLTVSSGYKSEDFSLLAPFAGTRGAEWLNAITVICSLLFNVVPLLACGISFLMPIIKKNSSIKRKFVWQISVSLSSLGCFFIYLLIYSSFFKGISRLYNVSISLLGIMIIVFLVVCIGYTFWLSYYSKKYGYDN